MATSGSFSTSGVGNFYFTFEWVRTGYNSSANQHYIYAAIRTHNTPGSYRTVYDRNLYINGNLFWSDSGGVPMYDNELLWEGNFTINSYNSAGDGSFSASFDAGVGISSGSNCSGSGSWGLDRIPRYTTITSFSVSNISGADGLTKVKYNWTASDPCDWAWYSTNNGSSWHDLSGNNIVSGLSPNTSYNFKLRVRRTDSQLTTDSGTKTKSTYDIAKISSVSNFNHGDDINVSTTNPANISSLNLTMTVGETQIFSKGVSTGSNAITLSDEELDKLYKEYGGSDSKTATFVLSGGGYTNSATCTVTLTGNQKTIKTKLSDEWKRGKVYVKVSDEWKKAVVWTNVDGTWKRSI